MSEYQKNVLRGIEQLKEEIEKLKQANNQLKEVLRKCSPWNAGYCKFCLCDTIGSEPHADDCEYVRLTGGAE